MRGTLALASSLLLAATASSAPVLVETYQEDQASIPPQGGDTISVIELSLSLDTASYCLITTGGSAQTAKMMLEVDGVLLLPITQTTGFTVLQWFAIPYTYHLTDGAHAIKLKMVGHRHDQFPAKCQDAYLQALIFLPDTASAVAEQPTSDAESRIESPSLLSSGPYVNVQGATELVDSSGRTVQDAISDNKVYITNLAAGSYFARDGEQTVIKIVKVQ